MVDVLRISDGTRERGEFFTSFHSGPFVRSPARLNLIPFFATARISSRHPYSSVIPGNVGRADAVQLDFSVDLRRRRGGGVAITYLLLASL